MTLGIKNATSRLLIELKTSPLKISINKKICEIVSTFFRDPGVTGYSFPSETAACLAVQDHVSDLLKCVSADEFRIEILKIMAVYDGYLVSRLVPSFEITDQKALITIAKTVAAQNDNEAISQYLKNYGILDLHTRIDIAKIAAAQNGLAISCYIKNYDITDPQVLIDILQIAAAHAGPKISLSIHNYNIQDQNVLIAIAKKAAFEDGQITSQYIKNYGIKDQKALVAIAKIAVVQNSRGTSQYIKNYGIRDPQDLIDIATLGAAKDTEGTSQYIQNYGILKEATRIAIAKIAAAQPNGNISCHIKNYNIKNQNALTAIAKIAAAQNSLITSEYIQNYGITDLQPRISIVKMAAAHNGFRTSASIQNYGITDPKAMLDIFLVAFTQNPQTLNFIKEYDRQCCSRSLYLNLFKKLENNQLEDVFAALSKNPLVAPLLEKIRLMTDPSVQHDILVWTLHFLSRWAQAKLSPESIASELLEFIEKTQLFQEALDYHHPTFRYQLTEAILHFASSQDAREFFNTQMTQTKHWKSSGALPLLFISLLQTPKTPYTQLIPIINHSLWKDSKKLKIFVSTLHLILTDKTLQPADKEYLLKQMGKEQLPQKKIHCWLNYLYTLLAVFELKESGCLTQKALEKEPLETLLLSLFQKHLKLNPIEDFSERYETHFGAARIPHYILTYIGNIQSLAPSEKQALLSLLTACVEGILTGTLQTLRYDLETNPHLKAVFAERETLLKDWKQGASAPLSQYLEKDSSQEQKIDFKHILKTKIVNDKHVPLDEVPILANVLEGVLEARDALEALKTLKKTPLVELQKDCILLSLETTGSENAQQLLDSLVNHATQFQNFQYDLQGLLKSCRLKQTTHEGWMLVDTEDPQDLFLVGTEIEGSCQRITGDASLNKCLLGYVADGKNHIIALKDVSGRIMARGILRILLDGDKPVLFLERLYPSVIPPEHIQALERFAIENAKRLNLPLLSKEVGKGLPFERPLTSLGSNAPYEYSDASEGITTGTYTITSSRVLYHPGA